MQSSLVPLPNFQFARRCLCLRGGLPVRSSQALERSCLRGDRTHKPDRRRHRAAPSYQPRLFCFTWIWIAPAWDVTPHFSKFLPGAQGHAHAPGQGRRCCPGSPSVGSWVCQDSAVGLIWPRTPCRKLKKSKKPVWRVARNRSPCGTLFTTGHGTRVPPSDTRTTMSMLQNYYHLCLGVFFSVSKGRSLGCSCSAAVSWLFPPSQAETGTLQAEKAETGTPPGAHSGPASVTRHSAHNMGAAERVVADEQS